MTAVAPLPPPPPVNVTKGVGSRLPIVQLRVVDAALYVHDPAVVVDDEWLKPNGIESVTTRFVARDGPAFVTATLQFSAVVRLRLM